MNKKELFEIAEETLNKLLERIGDDYESIGFEVMRNETYVACLDLHMDNRHIRASFYDNWHLSIRASNVCTYEEVSHAFPSYAGSDFIVDTMMSMASEV